MRLVLDNTVEQLTEATATVVDKYSQTEANHLRWRWQESCVELG